MLQLCPVSLADAKRFIGLHHRHHKKLVGGLFAVAVSAGDMVVGVAVVGRPVARMEAKGGYTAEVTRCCVLDGYSNACSMLYGACWRASRALGYRRLITYTLAAESGGSLVASGWRCIGQAGGGSWSRKGRPRVDHHPIQRKFKWERAETALPSTRKPQVVSDGEGGGAQTGFSFEAA